MSGMSSYNYTFVDQGDGTMRIKVLNPFTLYLKPEPHCRIGRVWANTNQGKILATTKAFCLPTDVVEAMVIKARLKHRRRR